MSAVLKTPGPVAAPGGSTVAAPPPAKYEFDSFFQSKIAALTTRDPMFAMRTDGLVRPEYFENQGEAEIVAIASAYYEKYKRIPADQSVYATLIKEKIANKTMKNEVAKIVLMRMRELYNVDISDREYVVDQVSTFARHQAVQIAMHDAIMKLDRRDFEGIAKVMRGALDVGAHVDTGAYDLEEMQDSRLGERLDIAAGKRPPTGITTGYPALDERLYHKGWGRRELAVLMAGAKKGKTTAMMDFGVNAYAAHHSVLYVTLEVSAKIIAERMDACIAGMPMFELVKSSHAVNAQVKKFIAGVKAGAAATTPNKFIIHEFPSGSFQVKDLRRLVERYKAKGIKFDLIVVDYADLMAPERYTDSATENSKSVYVNLRGFAMQEDVAILTATQTNRQGYTAAVARAEHVAEDFNKIRIADIVISINSTEEEAGVKQARLFFAACRNQPGGYSIRIEQDLERMKFIKKVMGVE